MKQMFLWGSIGRFDSSRSWFTITVALPRIPPTHDDDNNMRKTRNEDGADLNSAIREYEKLRRHTADVSKPPWRLSKGRHSTLIGPVANGAEAHSFLRVEPNLTK